MAHPCSKFVSGSSGADITLRLSDLCARCAVDREGHDATVNDDPNCNSCGRAAELQLKCRHYYCWLCYDRGRDQCNPLVRIKDVERWEVVG